MLSVEPEALRLLSAQAMTDIAHLLRPGHLQQLANILEDPEASDNDRFVAMELLKNANGPFATAPPGRSHSSLGHLPSPLHRPCVLCSQWRRAGSSLAAKTPARPS